MTRKSASPLGPDDVKAAALIAHAAGVCVVPPMQDGSKMPIGAWKQFQKKLPDIAELRCWYSRGRTGLGVVTGAVSGSLEALDFDEAEAYENFLQRAKEWDLSDLVERMKAGYYSRTPKGGAHWLYRCSVIERSLKLARRERRPDEEGKGPVTLIETRGEGGYLIEAPSHGGVHQSGRPYELVSGGFATIATVTPEERDSLLSAARSLDRLPRKEPRATPTPVAGPRGERPGDDFNFRATWEDVLEPHGWEVVYEQDGVTYWRRPGKAQGVSATTGRNEGDNLYVFSTSTPFDAETAYSKFAAYAVLDHDGDFRAASRALAEQGYGAPTRRSARRRSDAAGPASPGPTLEVLEFEPFPVHALPEPLQAFVTKGAAALQCDASYLALPALVAAAAAIGNTRLLEIKPDYRVRPILWGAIVGESGTTKTPALQRALRPVRLRQGKVNARLDDERRRHEAALVKWRALSKKWERKAEGDPPDKPAPPRDERYLVGDTTVEALAPILRDNPRGVLLFRDELSGWFGSFDQYRKGGKGGGDAAHWLSAFDAAPWTVDRKQSGGAIFIPEATVCVVGGVQPAILRRVLGDEHRESGLAARLLVASPPRRVKQWTEADVDGKAEAAVARVFERLYDLQPIKNPDGESRPRPVRMSADAKKVWIDFYNAHAAEQSGLEGDLAAAWSKLEAYAAKLALVVHEIRLAAGDKRVRADTLNPSSMKAGVELVEWFKREARRVYAMLAESAAEAEMRRLVDWIRRQGSPVTERQVQQGCRWLRGPGKAEAALSELADAGLGRWHDVPTTKRGGRPTRVFSLSAPDVANGTILR